MGILFGGSTVENEAKIEELEETIDNLEDNLNRARLDARDAEQRSRDANERVEKLADSIYKKYAVDTDDMPKLEDKEGELEVLTEDHVAWKATESAIVKLLLPTGSKVVHPDAIGFGKYKKRRTDFAIVAGMYDPDEFHRKHNRTFQDEEDATAVSLTDTSRHDPKFEYSLGEIVQPEGQFDEDVSSRCTDGIHLYRTKEGAISHYGF